MLPNINQQHQNTTHIKDYIRGMTGAQLKNSFTSVGEVDASVLPSTLTLHITANFQQLAYFILSNVHRQVIFFGKYALHHIKTEVDLCETIRSIKQKDELLNLKFGSVVFASDNNYELVPDEFLFLTNPLNSDIESLSTLQLSVVSRKSELLQKTAFELFSNCHWKHMNISLLKKLVGYMDDTTDKLFVQVGNDYLDVLRFDEQKQIQLMNRFSFQAANDFIYYLLLCANDLKIDRNKTELVLIGEVDIQSKIYDLCYRYFLNISFIQKPENIHFSKAFDLFPKHLHYALYNFAL